MQSGGRRRIDIGVWLPVAFAVVVLTTAAVAILTRLRSSVGTGDYVINLTSGGQERRYTVHIPRGYDRSEPVPLVMMLHGAGSSARDAMQSTGWTELADEERFVVVFPEGTRPNPAAASDQITNPQTWNDGSERFPSAAMGVDDVSFLAAVLDDVTSRYRIDEARRYVTGMSNGGAMAFRLAVELSDRIAAIAPVAEHLWVDPKGLSRPVSLLYMVGTADELNPLEGGQVTINGSVVYQPPVLDSVQRWAAALDCPAVPDLDAPLEGVRRGAYRPCRDGTEVVYYLIQGLGHIWPGAESFLGRRVPPNAAGPLDGTRVIWDFFERHTLVQ